MFHSVIRRSRALITRDTSVDARHHDDDDDDYDDSLVWDVSDPFAPPDPANERVRDLIQAEIARMRRYEFVGPLQSLREAKRPNAIALPPRPTSTSTSIPTPTPSPASSADGNDPSTPPKDLDEAEQQERVRKGKRDAHRSRLKLLSA